MFNKNLPQASFYAVHLTHRQLSILDRLHDAAVQASEEASEAKQKDSDMLYVMRDVADEAWKDFVEVEAEFFNMYGGEIEKEEDADYLYLLGDFDRQTPSHRPSYGLGMLRRAAGYTTDYVRTY